MNELDRLRKNVFDNLQEIERLHSIIKEAREEIKEIFEDENWYSNFSYNDLETKLKDVLEILDKEK